MQKIYTFLRYVVVILTVFLTMGGLQKVYGQYIYLEWVEDPTETMAVNWIDDAGGNSTVEYRAEGSSNWSDKSGNSRSIPNSAKRVYTVKLSGLSAGQGYEFRAEGSGDIYKFRTAPNSLNSPLRFLVAGDLLDSPSQLAEAKSDFVKVSQHAAGSDPHFAVIGGDLANAKGDESLVNHWMDLFELWHENMITEDGYFVPIVAAMGNNEVPNSYGDSPEDSPFFYTFFRYPQDLWGSKISYGKLDFNDYLSIVTLDSDHTHRIPGTQTTWLDNTLKNRKNFRHVIPVYHVAGWPTFKSRTLFGTQENLVRNNWHKVFNNNDIRLVFEHHDHIYKRTLPIGDCDDEIRHELSCENEYGDDAKDGVIYMGGGSWGSENSREAENRWYLDKITDEIHNFVVVEITDHRRTATAIGEDNQVLDEFTDFVFLDPPVVLSPAEITEESFTARWEKVEGAESYLLDISTDKNFKNTFRSYSNKDVGDVDEFQLVDLDPSKIYYYRVRAKNILTTSQTSEVMPVQLVKVDPDLSSVTVSKDVVEANEEDTSTITVTVIDEDEELVENFLVTLFAEEGNLLTDDNTVRTNSDGQAEFTVFNDRSEVVTYGAIAGTEEINQKVQVTFIPRAPVSLSATDVENRQFTANWEMVENTDHYLFDVATDSDFSNIISGYQSLNVGNVTSHTVDGVDPGTEYFYRVRAVTDELIGVNSQPISTTTFPDTPVAVEPSDITVISFNANWEAAEGAENYRLDVARDSNFESLVEGYENIDVGNVQMYEVDGLLPDREYYYRVVSEAEPRLSENSNTINVSTLSIDTENSEIFSSQLRVLANGDQSNTIEIIILGEDGSLQEAVDVQLIAENGSSQIEEIQPVTDEEGVALFGVTNTTAEKVTYSVIAATVEIGDIELEFLEDEGILSLGDNFPNPFRFDSSIPLRIPRSMHVELRIFNSLGAPVRTLLDQEVETGYYEVPFNGADLAAGVYFYRLITEEGTKTKKMVLVK
ncbi:MAG: fibronectin type III domain-containing protein [Balneolaceae bacterium]|nr:fibronectin type III domain-containing protein [Balneolaceae bacterium]